MKISVILLAIVVLMESFLPRMDVRELAKVPALIEHYQHHRELNPDLNFIAFIGLHYNDPRHHENDHATHDKLPYSSHQTGSSQLSPLFFTSAEVAAHTAATCCIAYNSTPYQYPAKLTVFTTIWQPPRVF